MVLERAGLITRGRDAQRRPCRIEGKPLADASAWLERYRAIWDGNFRRLDVLLQRMQDQAPAKRVKRAPHRTTGTTERRRPRR